MGNKIGAVMVVGGGISGIQSALDLADSGFKVYLVENKSSIGGVMAQLDKTFPTNDCAMCILAPKLVQAGRHHNITIINNADLEKCEGAPGNFKVTLTQRIPKVNPEKCIGCGTCAENCPVEHVDEFNEGLMRRKAISVLYLQAVPLVYSIDPELCIGCGACKLSCNTGAIDFELLERSVEIEVGSIILSPGSEEFQPSVKKEYGYGQFLNVVSSIEFERMLSATGPYIGHILRPSDGDIPTKLAFLQCVGSRDEKVGNTYCSSVCCMYALKEAIIAGEHAKGLEPHIFFMDVRAVGKEFEDYRKRAEEERGVIIHRGVRVASLEEDPETKNLIVRYSEGGDVHEEEFEMVVLSVGLCPPNSAEKLQEVFGIELNKYGFCETNTWDPLSTSKEGIFVSGSFAAPMDIPTTVAEASGAAAKASAIISDRRNTLAKPKEYPHEVDIKTQDPRIGVFVCHCGINIGGVINVSEVVEYAKTLPNVVYAAENLYTCSQDTQEIIKRMINVNHLNRVIVASCTPRTHETLFQSTIRETGLNPYLFEMANIRDQCSWVHSQEPKKATEKAKDLVRMAVAKARLITPLERSKLDVTHSAAIIGGGLSGMVTALEIAAQGFDVDIIERSDSLGGNLKRLFIHKDGKTGKQVSDELIAQVSRNEKITVHLNAEIENISGFVGNFKISLPEEEIEVGAIILTTGAQEYQPTEYFYGQDDRVVTQLELAEMMAEKPLDAKTVVMIQCVGSRTDDNPMCSRICCTTAMNNAISVKRSSPESNVYMFYKDIRTYGFKEDLYREAGELGVKFIRMPDNAMPDMTLEEGIIEVSAMDVILGDEVSIRPDLVVLSTGIRPNPDNEELARMLKVPLSKDGFFLEAHMKLRPVDFATEGVFLAGLAHWPKLADESIAQAAGAASRSIMVISKDSVEGEATVSYVEKVKCRGCARCEVVCEFSAITVNEEEPGIFKASINPALCKGCGTCAATCCNGAIISKHFTNEQILAMVESCLEGVRY
jgi:heterodisulfide reductase subunit A